MFHVVSKRLFVFVGVFALFLVFVLPSNAFAQSTRAGVSHASTQTAISWKRFTWGPLRSGDCNLINGTLTLYSDGHATWTSTTWTNHTYFGDVWHIHFDLKTRGGTRLYTTATLDSPKMYVGRQYRFNGQLAFNRAIYSAVGRVTAYSSC